MKPLSGKEKTALALALVLSAGVCWFAVAVEKKRLADCAVLGPLHFLGLYGLFMMSIPAWVHWWRSRRRPPR